MKASSRVSWFYVEWYKALGLCHYFRKHFEDVYPVGFISLLVYALFIRLFCKGLLQGLKSSASSLANYSLNDSSLSHYSPLPDKHFPPLQVKQ